MVQKKRLTDFQGTQVYPITHVSAVLDDSGNSVGQSLDILHDLYEALTQSNIVVVASEDWPLAELEERTIYRVAGTASYTDYMYDGTETVPMATYDNAIDNVPTAESNNLVTSGGIYSSTPSVNNNNSNDDLHIADELGYILATFSNGHIMTKHFDSSKVIIRDYSSKVVNCLGDSITYGHISSGNRANPTWVQGVADNIGCVCNNYGISATSICEGSSQSFVTRLNAMTETSVDVLLIFGGTNDYGDKRAQTLGSVFDTPAQGTNFYASFKYLIEAAISKYPNAIIAIITPLRRSTYAANTYGISMEDIVNAEINVANYYGLPVLDMYHHGSINPTIDIMRTNYTADGLHPNQAGINRFLIPIISNFTYNILKYL